ncbi:MAG: alpha/beta hydrolase [Gammaproteobacteria bacterium]|nr:alpha/beta hydrolase [Gammaproteobacteria bacterium]
MNKRLHPLFLFSVCLFVSNTVFSADQAPALVNGAEIVIWPGIAPGTEKVTIKQEIVERSTDPAHPDRAVTHTIRPILKVYRPKKPNGMAVVIAPGGGYRRVVIDKEGPDTSAWLNSLGVTTFVLYYRLPDDGHVNAEDVPLQDAQRAIRYVRSHAELWQLDPQRIGFIGYSAGGHLGATMAAFHDKQVYQAIDKIDATSPRPDFVVLGYPGAGQLGPIPDNINQLDGRSRLTWKYRIETPITASPPPAFIFHAEDDPTVHPEHSHRITRALRSAGGSVELHIFRSGGHGFGIRDAKGPVTVWPELCASWLRGLGFL